MEAIAKWLRNPSDQGFLPDLLQRQIQLGIQLGDTVEAGEATYEDLIEGTLTGDREWDRVYKTSIRDYDTAAGNVRPYSAGWILADLRRGARDAVAVSLTPVLRLAVGEVVPGFSL